MIFVLSSQDRQPSERLSSKETSRRHWVFGMVQNGMLWLEHTPATLLWDSSTKRLVGRRRVFLFLRFCFDFLLFFPSLSFCHFLFRPSLKKKKQKNRFPRFSRRVAQIDAGLRRSRCVSSCEEPDGRTWRNIWGHRGGREDPVSHCCDFREPVF